MARIVFMGTPEYAVPALEALLRHHEVLAVVTQPDRPAGRGLRELAVPPVKRVALDHGVEVLQPRSLRRDRAAVARLRALGADAFVLAAYGQILRGEVLEIPPHGVLGLHASLLPRWRGAAPVAAAILHGDAVTGVSLMRTDEGMDTGDVIAQRAIPIAPRDTTLTLTARLADLAADLIVEALPEWLAGRLAATPQDEARATQAPPIAREQGEIDWRQSAIALDRLVRAMTPWPGAYTSWEGRTLKVLEAEPLERGDGGAPGTVVRVEGGLAVATGEGLLRLLRVQLAGKRAMAADEFVRGQGAFLRARLGTGGA